MQKMQNFFSLMFRKSKIHGPMSRFNFHSEAKKMNEISLESLNSFYQAKSKGDGAELQRLGDNGFMYTVEWVVELMNSIKRGDSIDAGLEVSGSRKTLMTFVNSAYYVDSTTQELRYLEIHGHVGMIPNSSKRGTFAGNAVFEGSNQNVVYKTEKRDFSIEEKVLWEVLTLQAGGLIRNLHEKGKDDQLVVIDTWLNYLIKIKKRTGQDIKEEDLMVMMKALVVENKKREKNRGFGYSVDSFWQEKNTDEAFNEGKMNQLLYSPAAKQALENEFNMLIRKQSDQVNGIIKILGVTSEDY